MGYEAGAEAAGHDPVRRFAAMTVDTDEQCGHHDPDRDVANQPREAEVQRGLQQVVVGVGDVEIG